MRIFQGLLATLVLSVFLYGYSVVDQNYNVSMTRDDSMLCGDYNVLECEPITQTGNLVINVSPYHPVIWGGKSLIVDLSINGRVVERYHAVSSSGVFNFSLEASRLKLGLNKLEFIIRRPWAVRASESATFRIVVSADAKPGCETPQQRWNCPTE